MKFPCKWRHIIYKKFKLSDLLEEQFREFNSTAKNQLSFWYYIQKGYGNVKSSCQGIFNPVSIKRDNLRAQFDPWSWHGLKI